MTARVLLVWLVVAFALAAPSAMAQNTWDLEVSGTESAPQADDWLDRTAVVAGIKAAAKKIFVNQFYFGHAATIARSTQDLAQKVFAALATLTFIVMAIKLMLDRGDATALFGELIEWILIFGLVGFFLVSYDQVFVAGIPSLFSALQTAISDTTGFDASAGFVRLIEGSVALIGAAIVSVLKVVVSVLTINFGEAAATVLSILPLLAGAFFAVTGAAAYAVVYLVGDVMAAVALALGPFLIAFGMFEPTRQWMTSWIEFLCQSLLIKVVAMVMAIFMTKLIDLAMLGVDTGDAGQALSGAIVLMVIGMAVTYLMSVVPEVTSGMMRGAIPKLAGASRSFAGGLRQTMRGASAPMRAARAAQTAVTEQLQKVRAPK